MLRFVFVSSVQKDASEEQTASMSVNATVVVNISCVLCFVLTIDCCTFCRFLGIGRHFGSVGRRTSSGGRCARNECVQDR